MILDKAMIVNYYRNNRFIVLATINTLVNYDRKTFIVLATGCTIHAFLTDIMDFGESFKI
jgi:hypothetical protein